MIDIFINYDINNILLKICNNVSIIIFIPLRKFLSLFSCQELYHGNIEMGTVTHFFEGGIVVLKDKLAM